MRRIVFSAVGRAVGQVLALVLAVVALSGAAYLGTAKLNGPANCVYLYGYCFAPLDQHMHSHVMGEPGPSPPTRAPWQIPVALLLAGFGLVVAGAGRRDLRSRRLEAFAATGDPASLAVRH